MFDTEKKRIKLRQGDLETELEYSKELLVTAIHHTREALGHADEAVKTVQELPKDQEQYKREKYLSMSNLIYYLVERNKLKGHELDQTEKTEALDLAKELLAEVSKRAYPDEFYDLKECAAWARFHLTAEDDIAAKQKACDTIRKLLVDADISKDWRDDINAEWASYLEKFPAKDN